MNFTSLTLPAAASCNHKMAMSEPSKPDPCDLEVYISAQLNNHYSVHLLFLFLMLLLNHNSQQPISSVLSLTLRCYLWRHFWRARGQIERVWSRAATDEGCQKDRWLSSDAPSS